MDSMLIEFHLNLVQVQPLLLMIQMLDQLSKFIHPSIKQDVYHLTYKDLKDNQNNIIIYKIKLNKDVYLMVKKKKILTQLLIMSL
jgi:predicted choloylglycine hydrolase